MGREDQLWAVIEAVATADSEDAIGSIDVDIPDGRYPRQWLRSAAQKLLADRPAMDRECICSRCGIRHGLAPVAGDF